MPVLAILAAIAGVGVLLFLCTLFRAAFAQVSDLPQYVAAAQMIAHGDGSQAYIIDKMLAAQQAIFHNPERGVIALFIPPCGLAWLMPLALVPASLAPDLWKAFLLFCLALGIFALRKAFKLDLTTTCWLTALVCFSGITYDALRIDQVSAPMFLGYCLAIWALKSNRPYLAAFALTIFLLKPQQIAPFIAFLFGAKQYKSVGGFIAMTVAFTGIGLALVGVDGFHNYSTLIASCIEDKRYMVPVIFCTLRGQLYRIFSTHHEIINIVTLGIAFLSYVWFFFIARRLSNSSRWLEYGLIVIPPMGVALSPYYLAYDLLPLIPSLLLFMTEFEATLPPLVILGGMLLTMIFILPFSVYIHQDWVLSDKLVNPQFVVLMIWGITCMWLYYKNIRQRVSSEAA